MSANMSTTSEGVTQAFNPATGEKLGELPNTPLAEIPNKFSEARTAQKIWATKSFAERKKHIRKMRNYIRENAEELARIVSEGNGKSIVDAMGTEVLPCILSCDWYGKNASKVLKTERREASSLVWFGKRSEIRHEGLGVVGIISPWNYPLSIPFGEIVMGLMAGNAIMLKVAAATPLVGQAIEKIVLAGELPKGLFHHIVGSGGQVSSAFFDNNIDKLFFTGSVPAGRHLMAQAAETLTPVSLELGGNDPMIVLDDANIERAVNGAAWAGLQNSGQSCGGVERIYVHESIYDTFVEQLSKKVSSLRHGFAGNNFSAELGSMTTAKQRQTVERHIEDAINNGATVAASSQRVGDEQGEFHPAVVLTNVNHSMESLKEETFGPVLPVMPFTTEDEAVALANDCTMALTASIWTRNTRRGKALANRVNGGVVAINDHLYTHGMSDLPWGGPYDSGIGRTHGPEGLREMTRIKVVNWDWLRSKNNLWWYPHDKETYEALKSAISLAAPRSVWDFLRATTKVLPTIIKKMYFK